MAYKTLSKEERQKKRDDYEKQVADMFIKGIQEGTAPWRKPWIPGVNKRDYNLFQMADKNGKQTNHYRGINGLICEISRSFYLGSDDPRWCTVNELMEHNAKIKDEKEHLWVKKGEKGTTISFFERRFYDKDGHPIKYDENNPTYAGVEIAYSKPILRNWVIFNASQIGKYTYDENDNRVKDKDGNPVYRLGFEPIKVEKEEKNVIETLIEPETLIKNTGVKIDYDQIDQGYYTERDDHIHLVPKEKFNSQTDYYSTVLHELTHWTGVSWRLDREEFANYSKSKQWRAKEELVAEIGSYLLAKDCNIMFKPSDNNLAYVESWCSCLKEKPSSIFEACQKAKKASDYIQDFSRTNTNKNVREETEENVEIQIKGRKGR